MKTTRCSRREFLQSSITATSAIVLGTGLGSAAAAPAAKRSAVDQVTLGQTGIKLSRLGMGTGSSSGDIQFDLGREGFSRLIRYAYDQGLAYFDCFVTCEAFEWLGDAVNG